MIRVLVKEDELISSDTQSIQAEKASARKGYWWLLVPLIVATVLALGFFLDGFREGLSFGSHGAEYPAW